MLLYSLPASFLDGNQQARSKLCELCSCVLPGYVMLLYTLTIVLSANGLNYITYMYIHTYAYDSRFMSSPDCSLHTMIPCAIKVLE